jgi:hypothetical protein
MKFIPYALSAALLLNCSFIQADDPIAKSEDITLQENYNKISQQPGAVLFTPPAGWKAVDPSVLTSSVKAMVIGKGTSDFPPSINLGTEAYKGTLKQYLKRIKEINKSQGSEWKDLGTIRTEAGEASLSQVDRRTQWGDVRMMHVILYKNGTIYIMTAASHKDEFAKFYKDFFNSLRSLRFNKTAHDSITDRKRATNLDKAEQSVKAAWKTLYTKQKSAFPNLSSEELTIQVFNSEEFQDNTWNPFKALLAKDFIDMKVEWQKQILQEVRDSL